MIPLADSVPSSRTPWVSYTILAACVAVWLLEVATGGGRSPLIFAFGAIPLEVLHGIDLPPRIPMPVEATLVTSMFLHGSWMHLIGNMLYLWIFADNVEDAMGHFRFALFYLTCGVGAALTHILLSPAASRVPMVGASGAISGVLGAYALLYPYARVRTLVVFGFFWDIILVPAWILLGLWFLMQTFSTLGSLGGHRGGVAFAAHFGGFLLGMALVGLFKRREVPFGGGRGY
ncbi:MAG: rhomboid family intramembrane serine protease [Nitrospirae bacterium]|nr:MAG: rhomboid family intramembrane serine protease [Nitrospirota bacterium]